MNFTPIDNKGLVDGFCLIKSLDKKTSSKGDTYLDMTLSVLFYHFTLTGFFSLISVPKNYSNINYT